MSTPLALAVPADVPEISAVVPMYDEEDVAEACLLRIRDVLAGTGRSFEILAVDDGSRDRTPEVLDRLVRAEPRLVPVHFARNFGKESALAAGLDLARGRAVLLLDADLQHPPELIPELLARWDQGYDVVEAVKADRGRESWLYRAFALLFYALMGQAIGRGLQGASDFKLLDRQVVDALNTCRERNRFLRGLVAWVGFRVARVPFQVQERPAGRSKWSPLALVRYSIHNLVSFSTVPLKMVAWIGLATVGLGGVLGLQTLYNWASGRAVSGFTTVILLMLILCGLMLLSLGIVATYLAYMDDELKGRPLYVVRKPRAPVRPEPPAA